MPIRPRAPLDRVPMPPLPDTSNIALSKWKLARFVMVAQSTSRYLPEKVTTASFSADHLAAATKAREQSSFGSWPAAMKSSNDRELPAADPVQPKGTRRSGLPIAPAMSFRLESCRPRSEERLGGKEGVSTCRSRWSPIPSKKKKRSKEYEIN